MNFLWNKKPKTEPERLPTNVKIWKGYDGLAGLELTAWPCRKGWHCAPPCGSNQPVYATPGDAVLAHARIILGLPDAHLAESKPEWGFP